MRRTALILTAAALIAAGPASAQEKVAFKLLGGLAWVQGDDYNRGILGANRYAQDTSDFLTGRYERLKRGGDFQAEIVNYWGPHFGVGIGGGYYRLSSTSGLQGTAPIAVPDYGFTSSFAPKFSVIPLFLNFHYKFRLTSKISLDAFAGPVFQIMQFSFARVATSTQDSLSETETFNASDIALGVQGGLSASWRIWRSAAIVAEGFYRSGTVSNIKGNWFLTRTTTSGGTVTNSSNSYYFWHYNDTQGSVYQRTGFFDAGGPTGDNVSGARKANLNLSGLVILFGLKFGL